MEYVKNFFLIPKPYMDEATFSFDNNKTWEQKMLSNSSTLFLQNVCQLHPLNIQTLAFLFLIF